MLNDPPPESEAFRALLAMGLVVRIMSKPAFLVGGASVGDAQP